MNLQVTHDDVKNTEFYKSLSRTQQEIVKSWNNIKAINHGCELAKHKTFEQMANEYNFSRNNLEIIKELIESKK